ncbi:non-ribosomal peptide synthetase [Pseudomonas sp. S2_E01]
MNPVTMDQQDVGHALTPEQQRVLAQLPKASVCADALHFLEVDINGGLDPQRLQAALDAVLAQQPMLLAQLGKAAGFHGLRQFAAGVGRFPLTVQARIESAADIQAQLNEWAARSFVPGESENAQAVLYRLADAQWKLVFGVARHCSDENGLHLLYQQVRLAYEQGLPEGDDAPGEFGQYLEWRSEVVLDEDAASARLYWQEHLQDADVELSSPWLAYRKASAESASALFSSALEPALLVGLQQASAALQQPQSLLLQGAWWLLLARLSGQEQMLVGVRHDSREDYEYFADALGVFTRSLPLNLALPLAAPFDGWLTELAARLDEHRTWQEYWAPELAPKVAVPACGFAVWRAPRAETAGLHWLPSPQPSAPGEVELLMQAELDDSGAAQALRLHFAASRYSAQAIGGLVGQFKVLLGAIVANPRALLGQLSLLGADEQQRLLAINPAPSVVEARYLPQRIVEHARSNPDAIALTDATQRLSYGQLQAKVTTLAQALRAQGLGRGAIVALALPRSVDLVVAMLAAWQVGAAYLPLDPQWPQARQALMLEQAGAELLLVDGRQLEQWQGSGVRVSTLTSLFNASSVSGIEPAVELQTRGDDVAYVLFTSGSTGQPKGVVIEHRQLLNYTAQVSHALGLEQCRQVGFTSTVAADLGNTALFGALFNGATLHVASDEQMQDASRFAAFVQQQAIDCLKIVPSHLAALLHCEQAHVPRTLILGGEPIAPALLTRIARLRSDCRVFNHYGPTEATVGVLVHPLVLDGDSGVLSEVLGNNQVFVLDEALQLAPVGVLGELYLGGAQLCRGYLNAEADAQAFIQSPFDATQRLYRTGDLARYRPDLSIQLHGRRDQQIKVRGFRIELAEIEAELLRLPNVAQALVLPGAAASAGMLAFVVAREMPVSGWLDDLLSALALRLPNVMLPQQIQVVERFPRLANGKIDRKALQLLGAQSPDETGLEPRDALEQLLAARMAQLLDLPRLGIDRDFFAAGGHSLLVIKLVAGIRKLLQCEIQPGLVFDHPTVAGLAQALRASESVPGQLEKIAQARLRLDGMSPEEKALLVRQLQEAKAL